MLQIQLCQMLLVMLLLLDVGSRQGQAQSPFDTIGLGAMSVLGNAKDIVESGAAVRKEHGVDTPLFSVHSKTEVGYGNAMRPMANSAEDSDERRRRRRKRAPCHTGGGSTGGTGGNTMPSNPSDMAEEIRRRMKNARKKRTAQTKRSSGKRTKSSSGGKQRTKYRHGRRRRQAEQDDLIGSEQAQRFMDKMGGFFDAMAASMQEMLQRVQQAFTGARNNGTSEQS